MGKPKRAARGGQTWTPAEDAFAMDRVKRGASLSLVGERLGRTERAVELRLRVLGFKPPIRLGAPGFLNAKSVQRVMGVGDNKTVARWIESGILKARRAPWRTTRRATWLIYPADFYAFLQQHPNAYDYRRMPAWLDGRLNPYREWARREDPAAGYLSTKQAARALGIYFSTLHLWRRQGRIAGVHLTGAGVQPTEWFYHRADVERLARERGARKAA